MVIGIVLDPGTPDRRLRGGDGWVTNTTLKGISHQILSAARPE